METQIKIDKQQKDLYAQLLKVQKEMGVITKSATNPFFKNTYADINAIMNVVKPLLTKHGIVITQPCMGRKVYTVLQYGDSHIHSYISIPDTITDPQKYGSAITYFRRYTLVSLLGLQAEDDDGNLASRSNGKLKSQLSEVNALVDNGSVDDAREYAQTREVKKEHMEILMNKFK